MVRYRLALVMMIALLGNWPRPVDAANEADETTKAAVYLLSSSMVVQRDGQHNVMLSALRHLADPELIPYYSRLLQERDATLKIHGFLGLAEADPQKKLDLVRLAEVSDARTQADMISAAMDRELLSLSTAHEIYAWPKMDESVRLIVAMELVRRERGQFTDTLFLKGMLTNEKLARRGLAAIMLAQLGDPAGEAALKEINQSNDPTRDDVRDMLLQTAIQCEFERLAGWALEVARETGADAKLRLLALRTAMRFGAPGSGELFQKEFAGTDDLARKTRLALVALHVSPWVEPATLAELVAFDDAQVKQIGVAATAMAMKKDVGPALVGLAKLHNPVGNAWITTNLKSQIESEAAKQVMAQMLGPYEGPAAGKLRWADDVINATQAYFKRDPQSARELLRPILGSEKSDPVVVEAILLGLLGTPGGDGWGVVEGLPPFAQSRAQALALVLLSRTGEPLSAAQIQDLGLLVRGGGGLSIALRVQAAWIYLKRTKQSQAGLAAALR